MRNTKDLALDLDKLRLHTLVYGNSGTGKTTFAGTFPDPYFFDFNQGMLSLRGENIAYDEYYDNLRRPDAYLKFLAQIEKFKRDVKPFKTLVIDDWTSLGESTMRHIQLMNSNLDKTPNLHEWQMLVKKMHEALYDMKLLDVNIVAVALEEILKDDITGEIKNQPLIIGKKLSERSPGWFDEVYRCQVGRDKDRKPVYQILTTSARRYVAKSRLSGRLHCFEELEVPDYGELMKKIKEGGKT